ncbi:MAG TPA: GNAT family N-acetyltransferase [Planococcus sp. (in: firmicutes)]|nr:GNAT family N-acetyltransferase [Planococcus sp. (in: firmicutes)]
MEIRKLSAADAENYRELRLEALANDADAFGASLEDAQKAPLPKTADRLASADAMTFGAFVNGQLVGNVTLSRDTGTKLLHRASVYAVYVTRSARGQGIAHRLMQELIEAAYATEEIEQLYLAVSSGNIAALKLYENLGFEKYGIDVRAMKIGGRYIDEELMVKFL